MSSLRASMAPFTLTREHQLRTKKRSLEQLRILGSLATGLSARRIGGRKGASRFLLMIYFQIE